MVDYLAIELSDHSANSDLLQISRTEAASVDTVLRDSQLSCQVVFRSRVCLQGMPFYLVVQCQGVGEEESLKLVVSIAETGQLVSV